MTAALPAKNILDGTLLETPAGPYTSTMKTALGQLRDFLAGLLPAGSSEMSPTIIALAAGSHADLKGTATNDSAAAGYVGELVEAESSSPATLSNSVVTAGVSASLTAGDWDVEAFVSLGGSGATVSRFAVDVSTSASTIGIRPAAQQYSGTYTSGASGDWGLESRTRRISIDSTTTLYAVAQVYFGAGTLAINYASIRARRVR